MSPKFLVTDINRSVEFYTKKLGFAVSFWYEEITESLRDMPYGREFYIQDPDDHIIAFLEEK